MMETIKVVIKNNRPKVAGSWKKRIPTNNLAGTPFSLYFRHCKDKTSFQNAQTLTSALQHINLIVSYYIKVQLLHLPPDFSRHPPV